MHTDPWVSADKQHWTGLLRPALTSDMRPENQLRAASRRNDSGGCCCSW
jgi:hypothetical protein